jgi:carbon-monoxide dehydrogenase small subunit
MSAIRFLLNGEPVEVAVPGMRRLLDVLRIELGLTGTKEGCGEGECGACTVIIDSQVAVSCLVPACQVDGHTVRTVEGLAPRRSRPEGEAMAASDHPGAGVPVAPPADTAPADGPPTLATAALIGAAGSTRPEDLSPLQRAFLEAGAAQCGICTPGMLLAAQAYLEDGGDDDEASIRAAIAGNLCRCTGYTKIVDAIARAAVEAHEPGSR